ncbi:hypothetical protein ACE2AJ_00310 [Aquihabitans daechungensis]|uniref:hypothetical protein n=1 Tax=Aquihabitans daechungensis TaxID=1052257 RepID=UPI003BA092B4
MTQLVATHLASELLDPANDERMLPDVYPNIEVLRRLNLPQGKARSMFAASARDLAFMSIPFLLAVHGDFIVKCIEMLQDAGVDQSEVVPESLHLSAVHEHLESVTHALPVDLLSMFHLSRRLRNRIIHNGGRYGSKMGTTWWALSPDARASWERLAQRPLHLGSAGDRLEINEGEVIATLAVVRALALHANELLQPVIPRTYWATLVVDDYADVAPDRMKDKANLLRRLRGYAGHNYEPLNLTERELAAAVAERERTRP